MAGPTVLWDFDNTLGLRVGPDYQNRRGVLWSGCLLEVLDQHEVGHDITGDALRPHLQTGMPWHAPDEPHLHLCDPDRWWTEMNALFACALEAVGIDPSRAPDLAREVRAIYLDAARWRVFDDTVAAPASLRDEGWRHVILSNHVPELDEIVCALELGALIDDVVCSARIGYEKPHPEAFAHARRVAGDPDVLWMVGDNIVADVQGAGAAGIPAVLVRRPHAEGVRFQAPDLHGAADIIRARTT